MRDLLESFRSSDKVLVFSQTKRGTDDLMRQLRDDGFHGVRAIHGDKC